MRYGLSYKAFDGIAQEYESWFEAEGRDFYRAELKALEKVIPKGLEDPLVLDVGAGTGRFSEVISGRVFALEPSLRMLGIACRRGVRGVCGICEELPFKDKVFDAVILVTVICFVSDKRRCISEIKRILKDVGFLVMGFINKSSSLGRLYIQKKEAGHPIYKYADFLTSDEAIALLEEYSFELYAVASTIFPADHGFSLEVVDGVKKEAGFIAVSAFLR